MARLETDPTRSSSGDDEEDEEVSSEGSESESEPENTAKPQSPTPNSSSGESATASDSDTDPAPKKPDLNDPKVKIKPISSTSKETDSPKKPRSKNPTSRYSPPPMKSGKRPAPESEAKDSKRSKKKTVVAVAAPDAEIGGEKKLFQRLWSEEDEILLIEGMISYVDEKGKDPIADVNDFHEFVKKSLHVDVHSRQMSSKVRRLKKKFENNVAKFEKTGKVRSFSNPHEKTMYELSKKLWGSDGPKNAVVAKKVKATLKLKKTEKGTVVAAGNGGLEVSAIEVEHNVVPCGNGLGQDGLVGFSIPISDEEIVNKGLGLLSGAKKVEMEEKWRDLKLQELEHFIKRCDLVKEQANVILSAMKKPSAN